MQQEIKHLLNSYKVIDAASDYITVMTRDLERLEKITGTLRDSLTEMSP